METITVKINTGRPDIDVKIKALLQEKIGKVLGEYFGYEVLIETKT